MTDTDGSGTMSFDEFIAYMNNPDNDDAGSDDHGDDDHDDEVSMQTQDFMNLTDDDGNGTLSLDEWIDYWNEMNNDEFEEDLDQEGIDTFTEAFEDYDYDANGEVDLDELEDLLDYIYGNSSDDNPDEYDDLNAIFDNNDADMSGDLDVNELDQFILEIDEYFMEEENMACYDTIMEEYDYVRNQTDCDDNGFIWMNLDDDHNENGIEDDYEFICDNGNIIHIDLVDNQMDDCGDGSDEQHSDDHGDSDETPMFTCDNGNEVPADYVDDGDNDCGDWSDEPNHNDNGDDGMDDDSSGVSESELFAAADSDNDGLVTTSDIVDAVLSMDAPTPQDALDEGDIDQSDNISWDEFVQLWNMEEDENDADDQHLNNNPQLESDLHAAFNSSDSDYDGNLSIDELQSFIDDVTTISSTQEEITEMITIFAPYVACVDSNSDGSLDQVEFSDFYGAVMYGMENTELVFCTVDSNQDGIVTVSEYVDLINQTGMYSEENPMTEQDWEGFTSLFGIYDTDGIDGLSLTEYQSMMEDISPGGDDGGAFICENGGEVPASFVDDGYNDCGDWSDEPNHSNNGDGGHGDHGSMFDWMISNSQDMPMEGSFDDYTIVLAMCTMDESSDDGMDMGMGTTPAMNCDDDVLSVTIADAMAQDAVVMFHDADMSGTISGGDMVHISPDIDVDGDWNMVRLYSTSADAYSDENPMLTPGFSSMIGIIALLGAALLTRRD